jgi:ribonuclease Z
LFSTFSRWETIDEVEILGGRYALERIHNLLYGVQIIHPTKSQIKVSLKEIKPGIIFEDGDFSVAAFTVSHRGPDCFGFRFEVQARRPFLADKADALGVPHGPIRRDLVEGRTVTLEDGTKVKPDSVLGPEKPGTKFVHVGDTGRVDNLLKACKDADTLVIEATYLEEESEMARDFAHLTTTQAASLARDAGVKHLILTHISRRYRERDVRKEAQEIFPNTTIARDFDVYQVERGECIKVEE